MPPGPDSQIFPLVSTFMPSVMPGRGSLLRSITGGLLVSIGLDVIGANEGFAAAIGIEDFLVGREGEAVGMGNVPDHRGRLAILPTEHAREGDAAPWILIAQP